MIDVIKIIYLHKNTH